MLLIFLQPKHTILFRKKDKHNFYCCKRICGSRPFNHFMFMKLGKFLPSGIRELSHSMEDKMQIKSEDDRKEKIDQQAKEKADKKTFADWSSKKL